MTFGRPVDLCTFLLGLLALAGVPPCAAQRPATPGGLKPFRMSYDQQTDAFRRLLFELGFQPLPSFAELEADPSHSLFIMLGDPKCLSGKAYFQGGLGSFVKQGGAVLVATDKKTDGEAGENLRKLTGVVVTGDLLVCPDLNGADLYQGSPHCPFVMPTADAPGLKGLRSALEALAAFVGLGSRPKLFRNPHPAQPELRVAANAPSYLKRTGPLGPPERELRPGGLPQLACLPHVVDDFYDSSLPIFELFAVGGAVGKGRVLVLADHSIFINRMILPRDNGNLEFAANCLHWLREGGIGGVQRRKVLFWDDGQIRSNFEVPLKSVPMPPTRLSEPAIVAAIDKTIANLEAGDAFNRALLEHIDDLPGGRERFIRYAVYLLTLAALLFLSYRFLWRTRYRPELSVPLFWQALREHDPRGSLLDQRRRSLLRLGNVWEMGHRLAREWFESAGLVLTRASPPRVVRAQGSKWQHWRFHRRVTRLWRLARGDAPEFLSPTELKSRMREMEELKNALANGTIRLMIDD